MQRDRCGHGPTFRLRRVLLVMSMPESPNGIKSGTEIRYQLHHEDRALRQRIGQCAGALKRNNHPQAWFAGAARCRTAPVKPQQTSTANYIVHERPPPAFGGVQTRAAALRS
jgi:hypothetical protein